MIEELDINLNSEISARVARGMALLDTHMPDWRSRIDVSILDIGDGNRCIIGQLFGHYRVRDFPSWLGGWDGPAFRFDHGFVDGFELNLAWKAALNG